MPDEFDQFRKHIAGERISEEAAIERSIEVEVDEIDFQKVDKEQALQAIDIQIVEMAKQYKKYTMVMYIMLILLLLSIKGVQFEISIVGVKLAQIQSVKEIILLAYVGLAFFLHIRFDQLLELHALKKIIYINQYGAGAYGAFYRTFNSHHFLGHIRSIWNSIRYSPIGYLTKIIKAVFVLRLMLGVIAVMALSIWIMYFIIRDVWINPNIDVIYARLICGFVSVFCIADIFIIISRAFIKLNLIDEIKFENFEFYKKGTDIPSDEVLEFLKANSADQKNVDKQLD